jgi:phosphate acetyltransferase
MVELRRGKGLTDIQARARLADTVVLGTMMLALDEVDGLVSGAAHTTANTIRPALQLIRAAPGASIVSSIFFMLPEEVLVYGDCAVNPNPKPEELGASGDGHRKREAARPVDRWAHAIRCGERGERRPPEGAGQSGCRACDRSSFFQISIPVTPPTRLCMAVQRSAHVESVRPMLQGLRKPVNDPSRGALADDVVYTVALTAIQAE